MEIDSERDKTLRSTFNGKKFIAIYEWGVKSWL